MFIVGLKGSFRTRGNSNTLMATFLEKAKILGADTHCLDIPNMDISPCRGCGTCERKGFCPIDDDMQKIYPLFRKADIIVVATPVYFYGPSAQIKAVIDRSQALWSRKYIYKLTDPGMKQRKGIIISTGATKGKNLFQGINLIAKYFFDGISAEFAESITCRGMEGIDAVRKDPTAISASKEHAEKLLLPYLKRKKVLFLCRENACRSQMAAAFAKIHSGHIIEAESAGSSPAKEVNPIMRDVMAEKGIDMAFLKPKSYSDFDYWRPDLIIQMGCGDTCPYLPGIPVEDWDLPDPAGRSIDFMRGIRDEIEEKVILLQKDEK
ncbi:MAG: NAD(P)H-dependent oxidoreductase [Deltaproteobacteria bacterium]|nr:NAD(P)H-dependent oxidoreductase [Deltaproteobacteria bacterium]